MAITGNKRRKIEHVSSEGEDDSASFASFRDGSEGEANADGGASEGSDDDMSEAEGGNGLEGGEEMEEDDDSADDASVEETPAKPSKPAVTKKDTAHEIGRPTKRPALKDTLAAANSAYASGTFKSNIFKLQVDELLEQIRPRHGKRETSAEETLHTLKKTIEHVPSRAPHSIDQAERELIKEKVAVPFPNPRPPKDAKYKLEFAKPAGINVVGSHALKIANRARESLGVDMVVQMPASLFQEKDYLNHRFFYKRAFYLACIASGLKKAHAKELDIQFQEQHDNPLNPCLVVRPVQKPSADSKPVPKWQINILLSVAQNTFAAEKLGPDRNCVRSGEAENTSVQPSTPFYNSTLRSNMLVTPYLKLAHKAATTCTGFRDACLLGSSWLRQRGFGSTLSAGGFGNFEWSALMALLLQGGGPSGRPVLSEGYSSYQLLKAILQLLALKDFSKTPLVVGPEQSIKAPGDGSPVVWDAERSHNLLFKMTPWSYRLLQSAARTTLAMLGDQQFDAFEATFILRADNDLMRFDQVVELDQAALAKESSAVDFEAQAGLYKLYDTLHRGLGDRVNLISIRPTPTTPWSMGTARPAQNTKGSIVVGLAVNPDNSSRTVDHGPAAEDKASATAFRKFWGDKSELRRFKDGSIMESLVWSATDKTHSVLEQVVRCILARHFGPSVETSTKFVGTGFTRILRGGSTTAPFNPLMEAYKQLETDLRGLENMPLTIRQLMPADAQLRFASPLPPMTPYSAQSAGPAAVTLSFEGSARWPEDLAAIQRTKLAFLLKFSEGLQESIRGVTTRIGLENQDAEIENQAFLDVCYKPGAAFRLRIVHEREQALLEKSLKNPSTDPKGKELAASALAAYKRGAIKAPAHTKSLELLCRRHSALSGTIRLLKSWFASHLLTNHFRPEVLELFAARTFTTPWPYSVPATVQTGFLRTLAWLSRWDWRADPLIVDFSGDMKPEDLRATRTRFEAWRSLDPALNRVVLFAASSVDSDGATWTSGPLPSKVAAGRMTALSRAAVQAVETQAREMQAQELFKSGMGDYDFVLYLDAALTGGKRGVQKKGGSSGFKNLEMPDPSTVSDTLVLGYDPVASFLSDLENLYGQAVVFFTNGFGGDSASGGEEGPCVAGLWSPDVQKERSWKVNLSVATVPVGGEGEVVARVDKEGILKEIARVGGELVRRVEMNG